MADDNGIMGFLQGMNARTPNNDGGLFGGNALLIILFFLIFGGGAWGGRNQMNATNAAEYDALLAGQNQIKNQMGYDQINGGIRGLEKGICDSTYALNNTVTNGFAGIQNTLCQGISGITSAVANLGFNLAEKMNVIAAQNNLQVQNLQNSLQSCCCDLKSAMSSNTQKVLDAFCHNENQALRDKLFEASQREQTTSIVAQLKTTSAATA